MTVESIAPSLADLERFGVTVSGLLPDESWSPRWDGIIVAQDVKDRLLAFGLFCLTQRASLSKVGLPVHGVALLSGPPGTGKTTLAQGLAHQIALALRERGVTERTLFAVVDTHTFPSEFLGESQRAVSRLFNETLPELAGHGLPTVVLLDEAETLAVSRSRASFETNPVDVHRATDAVLTGIDRLAAEHPNVVVVATTNDERAIDGAFLSRVDLQVHFDMPPVDAVAEILVDTLSQVGVEVDAGDREIVELATACVAARLDARRVRKLVLQALVSNGTELAMSPDKLNVEHLNTVLLSLES